MKSTRSPFESIPGIGPNLSRDLHDLGVHEIRELKGKDPETLYSRLIGIRGTHVDRCVLYVFRLAVYYAENETHDPECLKWWKWKDGGDAMRFAEERKR